jgi:hypothetical protein
MKILVYGASVQGSVYAAQLNLGVGECHIAGLPCFEDKPGRVLELANEEVLSSLWARAAKLERLGFYRHELCAWITPA